MENNFKFTIKKKQKNPINGYLDDYCQNPSVASSRSRIFFNSLVYLCIYLCVTSTGQRKNDTNLKFGTHTPIDLIKNGFFGFSIKSPWRPVASKNYCVMCIFRISPRLPCFSLWTLSFVDNWVAIIMKFHLHFVTSCNEKKIHGI